eukprot:345915-Alexandrium_andersonii.AAC.1
MFAAPHSYPHLLARSCRATECPGTSSSFCQRVTSGVMRSASVHKGLRCQNAAAPRARAGARLQSVLGDGC